MGVKNDVKIAAKRHEKAAAQGLAILGEMTLPKGAAFGYQSMCLSAAKQILTEYAKRILLTK